jgi:hypothetical protein
MLQHIIASTKNYGRLAVSLPFQRFTAWYKPTDQRRLVHSISILVNKKTHGTTPVQKKNAQHQTLANEGYNSPCECTKEYCVPSVSHHIEHLWQVHCTNITLPSPYHTSNN